MATAKKTSTAVAKRSANAGAVANIMDTLRKQAEDNASRLEPGTGKSIRITQDKSFVLPDGTKTRDPLELVIVDFVSKNAYYEGAYDKDNIVPPNCFAIGPDPKVLVPSANSPEKQHDTCKGCQWNEFNSAPQGGGKACKNSRLLAVLPPDADDETEIWTLAVSPTAIKAFDTYVANLQRTLTLPPIGVVTTVGFDDTVDYARLTFTDPQPNQAVAEHFARQGEARELLMREPDVSSFGQEAKKPAAKPAARGKAPVRRAAR